MLAPTPFALVKELFRLGPRNLRNLVCGNAVEVMNDKKTMELLRDGFSFVRWGDGETALARGKQIGFQKQDRELARRLLDLWKQDYDKLIIGVPWVLNASLFDTRWSMRMFKIMFSTRVFLLSKIRVGVQKFGRTEFFWDHSIKLDMFLRDLCQSRPVLLISNEKQYLKICPQGTKFLKIKSVDAFADFEKIERNIGDWLQSVSPRSPIILVSAGPTAKVIVSSYANQAQVLDLGHGLRFALLGKGNWAWTKELK